MNISALNVAFPKFQEVFYTLDMELAQPDPVTISLRQGFIWGNDPPFVVAVGNRRRGR